MLGTTIFLGAKIIKRPRSRGSYPMVKESDGKRQMGVPNPNFVNIKEQEWQWIKC